MKQVIYTSALQPGLNASSLRALLITARARNASCGLSGILLLHAGTILQVLEGNEPYVSSTFGRILRDPRHSSINILSVKESDTREFGNSPMALFDKSQDRPVSTSPIADLQVRPLLAMNESAARHMLQSLAHLTVPEPAATGSLLQFIPHSRQAPFAVPQLPAIEPFAVQGIM